MDYANRGRQIIDTHDATIREVFLFFFTSSAGVVAKYCNERVCVSVCVSVCVYVCVCQILSLSVCSRAYLSYYTRNHYHIFVHVAYGLGSVLFRPSVAIPRGRDNFGSFFPIYNALYEPYSGINFATKNRFGLNLLIYCKVGQNLIYYY